MQKTDYLLYRLTFQFDFRKSVHHHTIQINQPTRCNSFTRLLLYVCLWLNTFRASLRPSSGAYNCTRRLWFYRWDVPVGALLVVVRHLPRGGWSLVGRGPAPARQRPTTLQPPCSSGKTRGSQCSCMLLMMGGETPETC